MFKHLLTLLAVSIAALAISACGKTPNAADPEAYKVALIVSGSTSDHGWTQLAADSLAAVAMRSNVQVTILEKVSPDKALDQIRACESRGIGLVIAHGYEFQGAVLEITDPKKPNPTTIKIALSGGTADSPNFRTLQYDMVPAAYQLGIIAAKTSATGKIGSITGEKNETAVAMEKGFEAGAKSVKPDISLTAVYTDSWEDTAKAKTAAEGLMANGVDVILQNVDSASAGVFEAIKEHNAKDASHPAYVFGSNSNQNANKVCPQFTLASAVIKMDDCFDKAIQDAKGNTFKGGLVKEDLATGHVLTVINPALLGKIITPDTQKLVEDAAKKIAAGEIKVPTH